MIVRTPQDARVPTEATVAEAAQVMLREDVDELPVVEGEDVVGVVSCQDLVAKVVARELDPEDTRIADVARRRRPSPRRSGRAAAAA